MSRPPLVTSWGPMPTEYNHPSPDTDSSVDSPLTYSPIQTYETPFPPFTDEEDPDTRASYTWCPGLLRFAHTQARKRWRLFRTVTGSSSPSLAEKYDVTALATLASNNPFAKGGFCDLYHGYLMFYGAVVLRRPRYLSFDGATRRRWEREIGLLCSVSHPNILPFLGHCIIGRDHYVVSPYMKKGDLSHYIRTRRAEKLDKILLDIACALAHLHSIGIVHGDIKAGNVLLSDEGVPLLSDFGLAKNNNNVQATSTDVKGSGSLRWMAPELFDNAPKTKATDVYAFGMMIAEVLTGQMPLAQINDFAFISLVYGEQIRPKPPDLWDELCHKELWAIAEHCWTTDPLDRPAMDHVVAQLSKLQN